jgi:hypothetical protein
MDQPASAARSQAALRASSSPRGGVPQPPWTISAGLDMGSGGKVAAIRPTFNT